MKFKFIKNIQMICDNYYLQSVWFKIIYITEKEMFMAWLVFSLRWLQYQAASEVCQQ